MANKNQKRIVAENQADAPVVETAVPVTKDSLLAEIASIKTGTLALAVSSIAIGRRIMKLGTPANLELLGFMKERQKFGAKKGETETVPDIEALYASLEGAWSRATIFNMKNLACLADVCGIEDGVLCGIKNKTPLYACGRLAARLTDAAHIAALRVLVLAHTSTDGAAFESAVKSFAKSVEPEKEPRKKGEPRESNPKKPQLTEFEEKQAAAAYQRANDWRAVQAEFAGFGFGPKHLSAIKGFAAKQGITPENVADAILELIVKAQSAPSKENTATQSASMVQ